MKLPSLTSVVSALGHQILPAALLVLWLAVIPAALAQATGFYLSPISQGSEPSSPARLQVVRCCTAEFPAAAVMLVTADGIATAGLDYVAMNTNLTFAVGEMER